MKLDDEQIGSRMVDGKLAHNSIMPFQSWTNLRTDIALDLNSNGRRFRNIERSHWYTNCMLINKVWSWTSFMQEDNLKEL